MTADTRPLSLVMATPFLAPARGYGGPPTVVDGLCAALAERGHSVRAIATDLGLPEQVPRDRWIPRGPGRQVYYARGPAWSRAAPFWVPALTRPLAQALSDAADLCHLHLGFTALNVQASRRARRCGVPTILSPHGVYGEAHLRHRALLKWGFRQAFERRVVHQARAVHALTQVERRAVHRVFGSTVPVTVVPNGITVPPAPATQVDPGPDRARTVLYIGRIHALKGMGLLVPSFAAASCRMSVPWRLVVAGPDDGGRAEAEALAAEHGGSERVSFVGPLYGDAKAEALLAADIVALTSRAEGLPLCILEACAHARPVLITEACNLPEIRTARAGRCCECTPESVTAGLHALMAASDDERAAAGIRGWELARDRFSWPRVAEHMEGLYRETLRRGTESCRRGAGVC